MRRRILLTFLLGSVALAMFLALTTYGLTKSNLIQQRIDSSIRASRSNAQDVLLETRSNPASTQSAIDSLGRSGVQNYLIGSGDDWIRGSTTFDPESLPPALVAKVVDGQPASQIAMVGDQLGIIVGWNVPGVGAYFEFFSLDEAEATLSSVRLSLVFAALVSVLLGVVLGVFAARRAVKPVATAAQAASSIAGGRLDTRLETSDDPDLRILTESFNDMAEALQQRVERDARFASDVSHELRSPLMTLAASVEVMEARRDEMPERAQAALDLLSSDVGPVPGARRGPARDLPLRCRRRSDCTWRSCSWPSSSARRSPSARCRPLPSTCPTAPSRH